MKLFYLNSYNSFPMYYFQCLISDCCYLIHPRYHWSVLNIRVNFFISVKLLFKNSKSNFYVLFTVCNKPEFLLFLKKEKIMKKKNLTTLNFQT